MREHEKKLHEAGWSYAEIRMKASLENENIPFEAHSPIHTKGRTFIVDFLIKKRLVVECEGRVHQVKRVSGKLCINPQQIERDNRREDLIKAEGYIVLRFANFQVFDTIGYCLQKIKEALKSFDT